MSTLKKLLGCLGSQGSEGHFQDAIRPAHRRIAPLALSHLLPRTEAIILEQVHYYYYLDTYILSADIHYCLSHPVAPSQSPRWWALKEIFLHKQQSLDLALLQACGSK